MIALGQVEMPIAEGPPSALGAQSFLEEGYTLGALAVAKPAGVLHQCVRRRRFAPRQPAGDQDNFAVAPPRCCSSPRGGHTATGTGVDILDRSPPV